jgi:outer membrane protein TolC
LKALLALILIAGFFTDVSAEDNVIRLTLSEAIKMAVDKNLDLRAELHTVAQFEADVQRSRAIYDPILTLQSNYNYSPISVTTTTSTPTSAPSFFNISSGANNIPPGIQPENEANIQTDTQTVLLNFSLSQLLWTGGNIAAVYNNVYTDMTLPNIFLDKYWQTFAGFSLSQPLLKNFGRESTELNISVSRIAKLESIEHFKQRLTQIVSQVYMEYFKLFNLREELEARKVSLDLARKILFETQARFNKGMLPKLEILNAEFGVASREKDFIETERLFQDQVDVLRLLIQLPVNSGIEVVDVPRRDRFEINQTEEIRQALNRYDILEQKRLHEITDLESRIYRNKILPDLSLGATAFLTSLDRTYLGTVEKVPTWSIGLNLTYPIGNSGAENDYRKSCLKAQQIALQIRAMEENAANEVRSAIRAISSSYKQIEVTDRGRTFAEERLRSFIRKNEVGMTTIKDVLDVESDLINAKNNQIRAVVEYNNAIIKLWTVTGAIIQRAGIQLIEGDADRLYKNIY